MEGKNHTKNKMSEKTNMHFDVQNDLKLQAE